jgi:PAS domain S-box-containing protein
MNIKRILIFLFKKLWGGLTEPFESLPQSGDYRRAVTTSAFLLFAFIAIMLKHLADNNTTNSVLALLIVGYILSRTRWFRIAALVLISALTFPAYLEILRLPNPDTNQVISAFGWVVIPLLLSSLIYSLQVTIITSTLNFLALTVISFSRPELGIQVTGGALEFYGAVAAILIIVMIQRDQIERDRQKKLIISQDKLSQEILERERFAEHAQRRADQLSMVNKINYAISNLKDLDGIFQLIYEQVKDNFNPDVFFIALYEEKSQMVSFPVMVDGGRFWDEPAKSIHQTAGVAKVIASNQSFLWNRSANEIEEARNSSNRVGDPNQVAASIVIVPLKAGNRAIGALSIQSYKMKAYSEEELTLLGAITQQATVAIENARLFEDASKRAQRLAILNEIGGEISTLSDLPTLMENVYLQIQKIFPTDLFFIGLYDRQKNEISFPIMYDDGRRWDQPPSPVTDGTFSGKTILTQKPLLINEWTDPNLEAEPSPIIVGDHTKTTQSLMYVPMLFRQESIGVISAQSYRPNAYNEEDVNLLSGVAHQVAIGIENTRLLEETKQNAQQLSILNEIGQAISALKDLPELLEVVFQQAQQYLNIDTFYVGLYDPKKEEVVYPIMYDDGRRYDSKPDKLSDGSYLYRLLLGEKAKLINRTPEELAILPTNIGMLGNTSKLSASLMIVPLALGNRVIGVFSAQSYTMNAYDESDLNLFIRIANQVSIAIENSRLYTAAQEEIAERQKIEEQLRSAKAKYRDLVERVPAVIYSSESGATGRWFYVSPQIENLLGFTPQEWIDDPNLWYQQIHPDDREYTIATEEKMLTEGSKLVTEYRIFAKNGRQFWIRDESTNVSVSDNQLFVVQGLLTDITIRKQAEFTLKESEEKYHSLFITAERQARELTLLGEVQSALASELDLSLLIHTVVEAIAKTFGYIFVSLYKLENGFLQLQHQVGYEDVIEKISPSEGVSGKVINTGQSILIPDVTREPNFLRASPHIKSEICVPLFDGDEVFGILNVESSQEYQLTEDDLRLMNALSEQINIAIRRARLYADRAESLRREHHINEFAHALSSTLDLPSILETVTRLSVELIGADTGTVSVMSDNGMEMTNIYSFNEKPELDKVSPKGQGLIWLIYEKERPVVVDEYSQHPNAASEWSVSGLHAFLGVPITIGEKCLGVMTLYNRTPDKKFTQRDVSLIEAIAREVAIAIQNARLFDALQKELAEHKQTQDQLQILVHELEAKNAELERFTYSVSHDLKSPLVTIAGFLGFLEADVKKGEIQRIENTINRIRDATKKMQRLLDELLELSRIGRLINQPSEVPFGDLVKEALELVHGQLTEKQVQVKIEADLPIVNVDRVRMVEVLQNLIVNAVKFMGQQENPIIEIGMKIINGESTFFVRDNGIGIASQYRTKVFGLFDKLDAASDGTGIGLALVKRIVEVHGGTIWVESEIGKGATFFFTLEPKKAQESL